MDLDSKPSKNFIFLWLYYMREIIDFGKIEASETAIDAGAAYGGRMPAVLDENLQLKICRADMHGCLMKVTRALNSCLIGIQGIVVMETRNTSCEMFPNPVHVLLLSLMVYSSQSAVLVSL